MRQTKDVGPDTAGRLGAEYSRQGSCKTLLAEWVMAMDPIYVVVTMVLIGFVVLILQNQMMRQDITELRRTTGASIDALRRTADAYFMRGRIAVTTLDQCTVSVFPDDGSKLAAMTLIEIGWGPGASH